jgi:glycosyltransferase involved in cell wall biosynthesis
MVGNKPMNLIFVSANQYPDGGAAANRHMAYVKGLKELGHEIEFILINKQQWKEKELIQNGIKFTNLYENLNSPSLLKKIQFFVTTINKAKKKISEYSKKDVAAALILLDPSVRTIIPLLKQGKKSGLKIFHERTEYPFVVASKTFIGKLELYIYLKFLIKKFDGIYVINNVLKNYFSKITKNKVPVKVINMIVDPARFECVKRENSNDKKIITYCGSLEGDKDGVPILIDAFAIVSKEFPNLKLQLIGSLENDVTAQKIKSLLQKSGIENKVILTGSVKREDIPKFLVNSDILALARPANKQAEGGFPTKLGEYLATGNPVVVTNVGEIGLFLKDKKNAFVAEPDNAKKFSEKLREALINDDSPQIGIEGKKLVYDEFNYLTQAKILEQMFLENQVR